MRSFCIKLNDKNYSDYLLKNLENSKHNIQFSYHKFKVYHNIIVHYLRYDYFSFLSDFSHLLSDLIIDFYEKKIIKSLILINYFYLSTFEQEQVYNICVKELGHNTSFKQKEYISSKIFEYLCNNKTMIVHGFITFRLPEYIKFLDSIVDISVNKFIIDKEYFNLIELLKNYLDENSPLCDVVHLVYKDGNSILLDKNENIISEDKNFFGKKFLSDITFSSNDYAINTLLTLLPKKLFIHSTEEDEFINTLKLVFSNRIIMCNGCALCNKSNILFI